MSPNSSHRNTSQRSQRDWKPAGVRIIAGQWRGRRLTLPRPDVTRPMTDRVKEAVFSILGSYYGTPGTLPALRVADLFAGSGSMGLEAISRGAATCRFIEWDREALAVLRQNLTMLKTGANLSVIERDAWNASAPLPRGGSAFDLVFVDPPYQDSRDESTSGQLHKLFERCSQDREWGEASLIVVHHHASVRYPEPFAGVWQQADRKKYGSTAITFFEHQPAPGPSNQDTPDDGEQDGDR